MTDILSRKGLIPEFRPSLAFPLSQEYSFRPHIAPNGLLPDERGNHPPNDQNVKSFESSSIAELVAGSTGELAPMLNAARRQLRFNWIVLMFFLSLIVFEILLNVKVAVLPTVIFGFLAWLAAAFLDQYRLTISLEYSLQDDQTRAFDKLTNAFHELMKSRRVWRIPVQFGQADWKRHAGASTTIERNLVSLNVGTPKLIRSNLKFLCLPLGDKSLYFAPDAILIVAGNSVAALRYDDLEIGCEPTRFIENEKLAGDAQVVGESWQYVNKNGTPDRRFGNNRKLPICLYAEIDFKSISGLNEKLHCSRLDAAKEFVARAVAMRHTNTVPVKPTSGTSTHSAQPIADPLKDPTSGQNLRGAPEISSDRHLGAALSPAIAYANESEKARTLIFEHEEFWAYLLAEELLKSKLRMLKSEYDEFEKTLLSMPSRRFNGPDFMTWLVGKTQELAPVVEKIGKCVNEELPASLGKTGVSGDAIQILDAVNSLFSYCRVFLAFELDICAADPPVKFKVFETAFRGITLSLVAAVERFVDEWGRAIEDLRRGSHEFVVTVKLNFPQIDKAAAEFGNVGQHPESFI